MDVRLTDEQIQQMAREFAQSEIKPLLATWDEEKKAGEAGMLG